MQNRLSGRPCSWCLELVCTYSNKFEADDLQPSKTLNTDPPCPHNTPIRELLEQVRTRITKQTVS